MAAGDWGAGTTLRPTSLGFRYDAAKPPNLIGVDVNYQITQPSGRTQQGFLAYLGSTPVANGIAGITAAINAALTGEGLALG